MKLWDMPGTAKKYHAFSRGQAGERSLCRRVVWQGLWTRTGLEYDHETVCSRCWANVETLSRAA